MNNKIKLVLTLATGMYFFSGCNDGTSTTHNMQDSSGHNMDSMSNNNMQGMDKPMDTGMMSSMMGMHNSMKEMKMSGDFDYDFANMMMAHHQGAIDMAQMEISKGSNTEIKSVAEDIVKAQQAEIEQFKNILKDYKMPGMKKEGVEAHNELAEVMDKMDAAMKGITMSGNADKDFLMMMIPHHEAAVKMAEDEISHGKNLALKKMAQKIIEDQTKEIRQFRDLLAKNR